MASTESRHVISCPNCGVKFAVPSSLSGRRARCDACNAAFVVPEFTKVHDTKPKPAAKTRALPMSSAELVGFECRVCNTRLYGRADQVGKKVKCPDCGAGTPIPEPPKPKAKNIPAALEGEQYELWDVDEQPLPRDLIATQQKQIAIQCSVCGTLMHARYDQVGQLIVCADCGSKHKVPPPPKKVAKQVVVAPDRLTPKLDPAAKPGPRPGHMRSSHRMMHEDRQEAEYTRALEKSKRTGKPMEIDAKGRPILPRWPLITGVIPFLFSGSIPIRWIALSSGFYAAGLLIVTGLEMAAAGGFAAISGMSNLATGCVFAMLTATAAAGMLLQVIIESAEGNRQIEAWPSVLDWIGSLLFLGVSGMLSAVPGSIVSQIPIIHENSQFAALTIVSGIAIVWPVMLLSQLDINSAAGLLSSRILGSIAKCLGLWTLFYIEVFTIIGICGAAAIYVAGDNLRTVLWFIPLFVAALFVFARLLGRLAWALSEKISFDDEEVVDEPVTARKNYNPPR